MSAVQHRALDVAHAHANVIFFFFCDHRPVLSLATISYLTYEGVRFFEELELACRQRTVDLKPHLRRMHLVTTAIHEFILTLCTYLEFTHFSEEDMDKLRRLQVAVSERRKEWMQGLFIVAASSPRPPSSFQCCDLKELRQLFLLLIRRFKPNVQSRQFLDDVVCGNHDLLVMMERVNTDPELMTSHLQQ